MLPNPTPPGRRTPRRSLAAACGLLSVALLAVGFTLRAAAAPAPEPKEEPKKEEPKKVEPGADADLTGVPSVEEMLKHLPANFPPDQLKMMRANMERAREQMKKAMELQRQNGLGGFAFPNVPFPPGFPGSSPQDVRLGIAVEKPGDTLSEQLELPRDQGLVVRDVMADSPAAKAGLKVHDILLELDGKAVSSNPQEFRRTVEGIKADTPVDAVVLRRGKKETIKGLSLPEAKAAAPTTPGFNPPAGFPAVPALPPNGLPPGGFGPANVPAAAGGVTTTTFRTNDHFTTRYQQGSLVITLTGKVADGKAAVHEISVQDGAESKTYESMDKVPEQYRDQVKNLMEMSEKGSVKVEIKAP